MVCDYEKRTVRELLESYAKLNNIPINVHRKFGPFGEDELHICHDLSPRRIEIIWSEVEDVYKMYEACKEAMDGWSKCGLSHFGQFEKPRQIYITTARGGGRNMFREEWRRYNEMLDYIRNDVLMPRELINSIIDSTKNRTLLPEIKRVHFSGPVTAVIWADGTKTLVRCTNEDIDYEKGLAMAIAKKAFGTNESGSNYYDLFKKFLPKEE